MDARTHKGWLTLIIGMFMLVACAATEEHRSTGATLDDASITARVKAALAKNPDVDAMDINVDTYQGEVQLSGFADSKAQVAHAEELAREVDGVRSVKNDIRVKAETGSNY